MEPSTEAGHAVRDSSNPLPISTEFAIREAVTLLRASQKNFKSRQVERARELLELLLREQGRLPWPPEEPPNTKGKRA